MNIPVFQATFYLELATYLDSYAPSSLASVTFKELWGTLKQSSLLVWWLTLFWHFAIAIVTNFSQTGSLQSQTIGILGGLGPRAHIEFERRLIQASIARGAKTDQDHPVWILINAADTPDRTYSLQHNFPACAKSLLNYAKILERAGSDFLVVTCNTAHAFYSQIQPQLGIPWLHLMDFTAQSIRQEYPGLKRVGLLATDGTLQAQLYPKSLRLLGIETIAPALHSSLQQQVMQTIYAPNWGIKTTGLYVQDAVLDSLRQTVLWLKAQGAEAVIAGCTELSIGFAQIQDLALPWIDPLDVLAQQSLNWAYDDHRNEWQLSARIAA